MGVRIYLDGRPLQTVAANDSLRGSLQNDVPFCIGKRFDDGSPKDSFPFTGWVDEVCVFDDALSDAEVEQLYRRSVAEVASIPDRPFCEEALATLEAYSWPGNIRELKNTIRRACILARDHRITAELLPFRTPRASSGEGASATVQVPSRFAAAQSPAANEARPY